ncbi:hypothetical protein NPIL_143461 [Nephila pilipes]|uniref:Uncharacterized protein n=1 Tax=Nephila pilipes TaxID=299642 RepID=A0A8X6PV01_NEPPI|nr:hypothetical protein NPIL_143461 [Nephila pilipes]
MVAVFWDVKSDPSEFLPSRNHQYDTLLRHPHETQVLHSTKETRALGSRCAFGRQRKLTLSKAHSKSDSLLPMGVIGSPDLQPRSCTIGISPTPCIKNNAEEEQVERHSLQGTESYQRVSSN